MASRADENRTGEHAGSALAALPAVAVRLFNPTRLFEIADADQVSELIWLFIDQMSARVPTFADAIAGAKPEAVFQIAHGLAGSAATVGASAVKDICTAICELTQHGSTDGASELHSQLVDAANDTKAAMLAYLGQRPAPLSPVDSALARA
jgi:HPt (histidine-containing phosphotransfer) domain-containing protein